ncbi:MAG: potassium channel protein [Lysobacterales bacterium]|nr:MAG: potassium channel protein [Xanthomonadales bacterium]
MNDIVWLTMRRMRTPLIALIIVYSVSVIGLVQIPGADASGKPMTIGFLDALYYVASMATTIGFGEFPTAFTQEQRLFAYLLLFPNVVAWFYAVGTIVSLFVDPQFRAVLARSRFSRKVRRQSGPFYIVCGFGHTGQMIVKGLLRRGIGAVVLEREQGMIQSMALDNDLANLPALAGDVTDRRLLDLAGLDEDIRHCSGVIAITNDDHANLTIAITAKLLRPELPVLARAETQRVADNLASFGTDLTVDPYTIFAERFLLALNSPVKYLVQDWLISVPGSALRKVLDPPDGRWIICGVGRFGSRMARTLETAGIPFTVIDVHPERVAEQPGSVLGRGTEPRTLREAGVESAVGIIAGTGDDIDNLSIVMTARELNPNLFVVARQESPLNEQLFDASGADLVARRSLIVARRILAVATTPLLPVFIDHMVSGDDSFARAVRHRLEAVLGDRSPGLWTVCLIGELGHGIREAAREHAAIHLGHLTENARIPSAKALPCVCLLHERGSLRTFLPGPDFSLREGDRLLFAGRGSAQREMLFALREPSVLVSAATGRPQPRGAIMRHLARRRVRRQAM